MSNVVSDSVFNTASRKTLAIDIKRTIYDPPRPTEGIEEFLYNIQPFALLFWEISEGSPLLNLGNSDLVGRRAPKAFGQHMHKSSARYIGGQVRRRWLALIVLELGNIMIIVDGTIVNVALASIKTDLVLSNTALVWVVNAYLLTFSGFMLLGGKLSDVFGPRELFLVGLATFTLASLGCAVAGSQETLILARAIQGLGGAVISAVTMSLTMTLFTQATERARAIGVLGVMAAGGGSIGLVMGGVLTHVLGWRWLFLINIPIGAVVYILSSYLLPRSSANVQSHKSIDVAGAISVTLSVIFATYAVLHIQDARQISAHTLTAFAGAGLLLIAFLGIEARVPVPLVPLMLFRQRNFSLATIAMALLCSAMGASYFITSLYLRLVLGSTPLTVALVFLPASLITAAFSIDLSKLVVRLGIKLPLMLGLLVEVSGLILLSKTPVTGTPMTAVAPAMVLVCVGGNLAFVSLLLYAMSGINQYQSGVAAGVVNTLFTMGSALGLAVLASIAESKTKELLSSHTSLATALNGGYHLAFLVSISLSIFAATCGMFLRRIEITGEPAS